MIWFLDCLQTLVTGNQDFFFFFSQNTVIGWVEKWPHKNTVVEDKFRIYPSQKKEKEVRRKREIEHR